MCLIPASEGTTKGALYLMAKNNEAKSKNIIMRHSVWLRPPLSQTTSVCNTLGDEYGIKKHH